MNNSEPQSWTVDEVGVWLGEKLRDFGKKASEVIKAFKTNDINGEILLTYVSPEELKKELKISSAGIRRKIIIEIDKLRGGEGKIATKYLTPNLLDTIQVTNLTTPSNMKQINNFSEAVKNELDLMETTQNAIGADLFISYSHADSTIALKLKADLERHGLTCWMDTHLKTGDDWEILLEENLTYAKAVVAIITTNYELSESCRNEIRLSINRGKRIFPVLVEQLKPTPRFPLPLGHWPPGGYGFALARTQYTDFTKNWVVNILLKDLESYGVRSQNRNDDNDQDFTAQWKQVKHTGDIPGVRFGSAFFNVGNYTVLYGGTRYLMTEEKQEIFEYNEVYLLDNDKMIWTKQETKGTPHPSGYGCSALLCGEGIMLCIGGGNYNKSYNDVSLFDFESMNWTTPKVEGNLPPTRYGHSSTLVNKKVYVFGGRQGEDYFNDLYCLDISDLPHKVIWSKVHTQGTPPSSRYQSTSVLVGGSILIYGGSKINEVEHIDPDVHLLDLHTMEWSKAKIKGDAPEGRRQHSAVLIGQTLVFFGGKGKSQSLSDVVVLDIQPFEWRKSEIKGSIPARGLHAAVQRGNQMLVFGGLSDEIEREFVVEGKGKEVQLLHFNDLHTLELI